MMRDLVRPVALATLASACLAMAETNVVSDAANEPQPVFAPGSMRRDPFWPVGWEPPTPGPAVPALTPDAPRVSLTKWEEARKLLRVTGLSQGRDGKYLAIVKGIGVVEEGDTVSVNYMGLTYKWRVKEITSAGIVPERSGVYPIK